MATGRKQRPHDFARQMIRPRREFRSGSAATESVRFSYLHPRPASCVRDLAAYFRKDRESARGDFKGCLKIMAGDLAVYFSAA